MQIRDIKTQLKIKEILSLYNLTPDKNQRLICPWHADKTPSLQIYPKTNTYTCFSTNCEAGSGDVIDLIMRYENITKHEALLKATALLSEAEVEMINLNPSLTNPDSNREAVLTKYFDYCVGSMERSKKAKSYLEQRNLTTNQIGYAPYDVGKTWTNGFKESAKSLGLLNIKNCIIFQMKNKKGQVVSIYGRSIGDNPRSKHFYLKGGYKGLYPKYPSDSYRNPKKSIILTESIIDAKSIKENTDYEVLALFGTNGWTKEHEEALKDWAISPPALNTSLDGARSSFGSLHQKTHLGSSEKELIFFFDGDEAGKMAVNKYKILLKELLPKVKISQVNTPDNEDVNSLIQGHTADILNHLIEKRKEVIEAKSQIQIQSKLNTNNPYNLKYKGIAAHYSIKGGIAKNGLESLKVTLVISIEDSFTKSRNKIDLYEDKQVEKVAKEASNKLNLERDEMLKDLGKLTDLLEEYREMEKPKEEAKQRPGISSNERQQIIDFLQKPNLIKRIDKLIEKSGLIGEEKSRMFLYCIASSHKMKNTLHALIQGSSGSGKTHLIKQITSLMPNEDVIKLTRVTESSFYNYGEYELKNKLIVIEDYDGLKEEAEYAFRELQSNEEIISSTSVKDENTGEIRAKIRTVKGPIGSMTATTRSNIIEDNLSRSFVIAVDESSSQTLRIIKYQNEVSAGIIDKGKQEKIVQFMQNMMRLVKSKEVINPFASQINLPQEAFKIRRLNSNFQAFIKQITLLNQYQRKTDNQGRLITEKEDIKTAVEIMFDSIVLKVDELDGGLRLFYERLKTYITEKAKNQGESPSIQSFNQREIRLGLRISKTSLQRYMYGLQSLDYIHKTSGHNNRGYNYKITYWDDIEKLRSDIKAFMNGQIEKI